MIIFILLIPVVACLILFLFFRKETTPWEYLVVIVGSILITLLGREVIKAIKIHDFKMVSEYVVSIRYYESWNEYVHRTCSRTVKVGKSTVVQTYDCSYVRNHPEIWELITKSGNTRSIPKETYEYYKKLWGGDESFIDMNRRYHTKDGDAYEANFDGIPEHALVDSRQVIYRNYFKLQGNLYSIDKLPKHTIDSLGLPEYPTNIYRLNSGIWTYDRNPVIGLKRYDNEIRSLQYLNAQDPTMNVIIVYTHHTPFFAQALERYWEKGKSNDVVFVIGLGNRNQKTWVRSFSWSPEPRLESTVKRKIKTGTPTEIRDLVYKSWSKDEWIPRDFSEYNYIHVDLSSGDYAWIFWINLVLVLGICVWVIRNEFKRGT